MTILLALMGLQSAFAECVPPKPNHPTSPVGASAPALGVVTLEIPLIGPLPEPVEMLEVLTSRGLQATLLVSRDWATRHPEFLSSAAQDGHEVGIWLSLTDDVGLSPDYARAPNLADWVAALRRSRKVIRKHTGQTSRTVGMVALPPLGETAAEAMAFRAILPSERTASDMPRRVKKVDQTKGRARVIGQGRYEDGCGHLLPHWSPAGLDRATLAAARAEWIRIGLPAADGVGPMLSQWLDKVVIPHDWRVVTAAQMAKEVQRSKQRPQREPPPVAIAKQVPAETWSQVAKAISASETLPTEPVNGINLTEAYFGLVTVAASEVTPLVVTLGHLSPPAEAAARELTGDVRFTREQVHKMATTLRVRLRGQVPAIVEIGDHSVTAAEALQLLARYVLEEPLVSTPTANPSPFSPGCGWGQSIGL